MSTRPLPAWPGDLVEPERLDADAGIALPELERILERVRRDDIIPAAPAPARADAAMRETLEDSGRIEAVTDRLRLLGYLAPGGRAAPPDRLDAAIRRFQSEAGLRVDGAPGPITWTALDQLVTFETATRVHSRIHADGPDPALRRAANLRLRTLGFSAHRSSPDSAPNADANTAVELDRVALDDFWRMAQRLRIVPFGRRWQDAATVLELLFDQDRLIQGASHSARRVRGQRYFSYLKRSNESEADIEAGLGRFLVRLARVELWLLGYEVRIDARAGYPVRGFGQVPRRNRDPLLRSALRAFARLADIPSQTELTPELFAALGAPDRAPAGTRSVSTATPASRAVTHPSAVDDPGHASLARVPDQAAVAAVWSTARTLGARLWDGFRRLLGWLRRGVRAVLDIGRNLARAFMRSAIEAWEMARFAIREAARAMGQWLRGHVGMRHPESTQVAISKDGDMLVRLRQRAPQMHIDAATRSTLRFGAAFHLAMQLLTAVLAILRGALAGATGRITGWARVLRALVESHRDIQPIYRELRALTGS